MQNKEIFVDDTNVVPDVHEVLGRIKAFTDKVRAGEHTVGISII